MAPVTVATNVRGWREVSTTAFWTARVTWPNYAAVAQHAQTSSINFGNVTTERRAQSFTPGVSGSVRNVGAFMLRVGTPSDTVTVEIHSDNAGSPSGTVLGTSDAVSNTLFSTGAIQRIQFEFPTPVALTASTKYWLVFSRSGAQDASNYYVNRSSTGAVYAGGGVSSYNGSVWSTETTTSDLAFDVQYASPIGMYAVVQDTGATPKVRVMKADDPVNPTSWSEQDSANNKAIANVDYPYSSWMHLNGVIHIGVLTNTNTLTHYIFDTDTDLWGTGFGTVTTAAQNERPIRLAVRSDGDVLVLYTDTTDDADIFRSYWEGASWAALSTSPASSTEAATLYDALMDSTDTLFFTLHNPAADDVYYGHVTFVNGAGVFALEGTGATAETSHSAGGRFNIYDDAGTDSVVYVYLNSSNALDERTAALEAAAGSGQVTAEVAVEGTAASVGARTPISTAVIAGTPYAAWWDDANSGTIKVSTKTDSGGAAWAAETDFATNITRLIEIVPVGTTALMVVYQSGSNVVMDWIVAPAGGETGTATVGTATAAGGTHTGSAVVNQTGTTTAGTATATGGTHTGTGAVNQTGTTTVGTASATGGSHTGTAIISATGTTTVGTASAVGGTHTGTGAATATGTATVGTASAAGGSHSANVANTGTSTTGTASAAGGDHSATAGIGTTGTVTAGTASAAGGAHTGTAATIGTHTSSDAAATGHAATGTAGTEATGTATVGDATAAGGGHTASFVANLTGTATVGTATAEGGEHSGFSAAADVGSHVRGQAAAEGGTHTGVVTASASATAGAASATGGTHTAQSSTTGQHTTSDASATGGSHSASYVTNGLATVGEASAQGGTHTGNFGTTVNETGTVTVGMASAAGGSHVGSAGATGSAVSGSADAAGASHTGTAGATGVHVAGTAVATGHDATTTIDYAGTVIVGTADASGGDHTGTAATTGLVIVGEATATGGTHIAEDGAIIGDLDFRLMVSMPLTYRTTVQRTLTFRQTEARAVELALTGDFDG